MLDIARCFKYNINSNKGEYTMSKVKQWAWDEAEKQVDSIINELKNNAISKEAAKAKIMNVDNVNMLGIEEYNVDEVIDLELEAA